jgi:hypothetical protein
MLTHFQIVENILICKKMSLLHIFISIPEYLKKIKQSFEMKTNLLQVLIDIENQIYNIRLRETNTSETYHSKSKALGCEHCTEIVFVQVFAKEKTFLLNHFSENYLMIDLEAMSLSKLKSNLIQIWSHS